MKFVPTDKNCKDLFWPSFMVLIVGSHSILLGLTIFFFTEFFYKVFFAAPIENIFFVRQSGIFLFLIGLFYLYPLFNLRNLYNLLLLVILSKTVAVAFLISNGQLTSEPAMIYLAAFFDGLMAVVIGVVYIQCRKLFSQPNLKTVSQEEISLEEAA